MRKVTKRRKVVSKKHTSDEVNHPKHYNNHPSEVECIDIVRYMDFNTGNVIKYLWRAGLKCNNEDSSTAKLRDMKKALFYLQDEIKLIEEEIANEER